MDKEQEIQELKKEVRELKRLMQIAMVSLGAKQNRICKCGCGLPIIGHKNKLFVDNSHKDNYWNRVKPDRHYRH